MSKKYLETFVYRFDQATEVDMNNQLVDEFIPELISQIDSYKAKGRVFVNNTEDHPLSYTIKRYPVQVINFEGEQVRLDRMTFNFEISTDFETNSKIFEHMRDFYNGFFDSIPDSILGLYDDWLLTRYSPVKFDD